MLGIVHRDESTDLSLDELEEFCRQAATAMDASGFSRLAAALHAVTVEARAAVDLEVALLRGRFEEEPAPRQGKRFH